jgi:hypothetical protein
VAFSSLLVFLSNFLVLDAYIGLELCCFSILGLGGCSGLFSTCCEGTSGIHKSYPMHTFVVTLLSHLRSSLQEKHVPFTALLPLSRLDAIFFPPSPADACIIPRRLHLASFHKTHSQWLVTVHGLWCGGFWNQKDGQIIFEKEKCIHLPAPDDHIQMQVTTLFRVCETLVRVVTHHTPDPDGSST